MTDSESREPCRFRPPARGLLLWEMTNWCNLACAHCCTNSSPEVSTAGEVSTRRIIAILEEVASLNFGWVAITGGEAAARSDFWEFLPYLGQIRSPISLSSNGTVINDARAIQLARAGLSLVEVSLDGSTPDENAKVRLSESAFDRALRGIRACIRAGIRVDITTIVTPFNQGSVRQMVEQAATLGVGEINFNTVAPSQGRGQRAEYLVLGSREVKEVIVALERCQDEFSGQVHVKHSLSDAEASPAATRRRNGLAGCPAGSQLVHVAANGDVSPCSWLYKLATERFTLGNIKRDSLSVCLEVAESTMVPVTRLTQYCPIPVVAQQVDEPHARH